jgi:type II secretory pathway component GspD/PulD (secretin)
VVAVADERSNAVVVSAPEDQMPVIEDLVKQVDINVDDITELRVFSLKYGDPQEMADLLTELFPESSSSSSQNNRGQFRFGGPGGFGGFGSGSSSTSTRLQQQNRVSAVPDLRTKSVVVSASRELMPEIAQIISQLDSDPAKKQKVHVFSVENSDPAAVEEILRGLFETQNTRNRSTTSRSNTRQAGSQLNSRATSNIQNQGRTTSRTGSSGFGTTSGMR